jgi:hypothetical protein
MPIRLPAHGLVLVVTGMLLAGCQPAGGPSPGAAAPANIAPAAAPSSPDEIVATDPTAQRLGEIGEYMMLYYRDHDQMPAKLEDLLAMPGAQDLQFTNASTGKPLVYQPAGMWSSASGDRCIILYDPDLSHGARWCLFMSSPKAGAALSVDVRAIPEPVFLNYRAAQ